MVLDNEKYGQIERIFRQSFFQIDLSDVCLFFFVDPVAGKNGADSILIVLFELGIFFII